MDNRIMVSYKSAVDLANAGWKKETVFCYAKTRQFSIEPMFTYQAKELGCDFEHAPTLEEIDLPTNVCIMKLSTVWVVVNIVSIREIEIILELGVLHTELEARVAAWIQFNKKEASHE